MRADGRSWTDRAGRSVGRVEEDCGQCRVGGCTAEGRKAGEANRGRKWNVRNIETSLTGNGINQRMEGEFAEQKSGRVRGGLQSDGGRPSHARRFESTTVLRCSVYLRLSDDDRRSVLHPHSREAFLTTPERCAHYMCLY